MKSDKGPWTDYELVRPLGIRKKGTYYTPLNKQEIAEVAKEIKENIVIG